MSSLAVAAILVAAATAVTTLVSAGAPLVQPGCETTCGKVSVPFPFGYGPARCSATGFNLTCDNTTRPGRPRLLLLDIFEVEEISIKPSTVTVLARPIFTGVRNLSGPIGVKKGSWGGDKDNSAYGQYIMSDSTELVVVGCNVEAILRSDMPYVGGCSSLCPEDKALSAEDVRNNGDIRTGGGYCHTEIGIGLLHYDVELRRMGNGSGINDDLPASVLLASKEFVVGDFPEQAVPLMNLEHRPTANDELLVPVTLEWQCINDGSCIPSVKDHIICDPAVGSDYNSCQCDTGYEGNPYVAGGCQDVDECKNPKQNNCFGECFNKIGSFDCRCPTGYHGNASQLDGCFMSLSERKTGLIVGLSISVVPSLMLLALGGILIIRKLKHHKAEKLKQKFFNQNRGQLLQQLVNDRSDIGDRMIISLKELETATNNFDQTRKLGGGGHGTVYKGILSDLHVVAIKKSNIVVQREIDEFINEVAILSQINHRNIVKLHGCCLETEVPLLAYEFISNGTLGDHLHSRSPRSIPWRDRIRISSEVAKAIAYLHSAVSVPIIHRDIKSSNVLLDDALTAKVSDFGASRYIPIDQTGLAATAVQGTIGYLDPMYYYTGRLSQMSDVYSFGVLLVELLTRNEPVKYMSSEGDGLVMHFVTLLEKGNLVDILDPQVVEEGRSEVDEVASLAASCLKYKGEERPTMRHIEMALEGLQPNNEQNYIAPSYASTRRSTSLAEVSRQYSQEVEFALSARYPR